MKTQFGNKQLITLSTVKQNGLSMVAAEGYRVVSPVDCQPSERLSLDCRCSERVLGSVRLQDRHARLHQSAAPLWRNSLSNAVTTMDPGAATFSALPAAESRLPAPAWAAFVLNHALCG